MGIDSQVCFHRGLFLSLSNHECAPQGLWSHWMALIRIVWCQTVANNCLGLSCGLWLSVPLTGPHTTAVCLLMVALTRLQLPTHPPHPPSHPCHPPIPATLPPPPPSHPRHPPTPLYAPSVILQSLWKSCSKTGNVS